MKLWNCAGGIGGAQLNTAVERARFDTKPEKEIGGSICCWPCREETTELRLLLRRREELIAACCVFEQRRGTG
jgi:hypothetical protein